jgi:uncharacterized protein YggU (UPF0235/DUF167 family)
MKTEGDRIQKVGKRRKYIRCRLPSGPHAGTGTRIVRMLAQELDAHIEISSGGDGTTVSMIHGVAAPSAQGPTKAAA